MGFIFTAIAVGIAAATVLLGAAPDAGVEACETDGGIGCADLYFGTAAFWFLTVVCYCIAALVAAVFVAVRR